MLQGILLILLLGLTAAAVVVGEKFTLGGVGLWAGLLFLAYLASLYLSHEYEDKERWEPRGGMAAVEKEEASKKPEREKLAEAQQGRSNTQLILMFLGGTAVIAVAGIVLARVAEALDEQTGLGTSFMEATLLAASTSLRGQA